MREQEQSTEKVVFISEPFIHVILRKAFGHHEKVIFVCVLVDDGKVFLEAYNLGEENSPCWNRLGPISVDGFRCPNKFLVVPQPTSTTLSDIWDLVIEKNVSVILSLNKITPSSTVSGSG
jgi:hypothetical protein